MMFISLKVLHKTELAEEAVQDALVKILFNIDCINEIECPRTRGWVVTIIKRTALDKLKYENRRKHIGMDILEYTDINHEASEDKIILDLSVKNVIDAMKTLTPKYSETMILKYYYGYSTKQLANHFEISDDIARKRCERGKKLLIKRLKLSGDDI